MRKVLLSVVTVQKSGRTYPARWDFLEHGEGSGSALARLAIFCKLVVDDQYHVPVTELQKGCFE